MIFGTEISGSGTGNDKDALLMFKGAKLWEGCDIMKTVKTRAYLRIKQAGIMSCGAGKG